MRGFRSLAVLLTLAGAGTAAALRPLPALAEDQAVAQPISALATGLAQAQAMQSYPQRVQLLTPLIQRAFNLPQVLQTSVGLRWSSLPAAQQQQLLSVFQAFTVARYLSNFGPADGNKLTVHGTAAYTVPGSQLVRTTISGTGNSTDVDYVMRQGPQGWQAVDVLLGGSISQIAVQRSDFRSQLSSGDASALIDSLKKKVQTLSDGQYTL
jgi:phospholipid transport system substrate-binding protein